MVNVEELQDIYNEWKEEFIDGEDEMIKFNDYDVRENFRAYARLADTISIHDMLRLEKNSDYS